MSFEHKTYQAGDLIVTENDEADCAFFITTGKVEIFVLRGQSPHKIGIKSTGALFGEHALIKPQHNFTFSAKAAEETEIIIIKKTDFNEWVNSADAPYDQILKVILADYQSFIAASAFSISDPIEKDIIQNIPIATLKNRTELKLSPQKDLRLLYQPIVNIEKNRIHGFEALVRWNHPEKGLIPPAAFLPVAEQAGLMPEITEWIISESITAVVRLNEKRPKKLLTKSKKPLYVSINLSIRDFETGHFLEHLQNETNKAGISSEHIRLEITETHLMQNPKIAEKRIKECQDAGFRVLLDDFGTGYSSLSYLHNFEVDGLKIDRSFIASMLEKPRNLSLVQSIIGLADNLNIPVIAEGVEHADEIAALKELGCTLCQGFWLAKPMDQDETLAYLEKNN